MVRSMTAALLQGPGRFTLENRPVPVPGPDDILVRTTSCGICTSELEIWRGKIPDLTYPRLIGHEPSGIVEAVGANVTGFAVGDPVAVWSEGNGYAEYFVSKAAYAYKLRSDTDRQEALGEPIACSVNGVRKLDPQLNDSVCIVGCGFMGLIMLQVFRAQGVGTVIAVDLRKSICDLALQLGATHALSPAVTDVVAAVKDLTGGRGVDIGVEAAGTQGTLDLTGQVVRMEGKLEVFGFHVGESRTVPWGFWNWMAFTIVNGHVRSAQTYVDGMTIGLKMLEAGKLRMKPLVTHRFPLEDIGRAFEVANAKEEGFVKGVITVDR
jgi:L-iditol 2-dehydrogenase